MYTGYGHNGFVATHGTSCPSCDEVHELQSNHCGDSKDGTLHLYYANVVSMRF